MCELAGLLIDFFFYKKKINYVLIKKIIKIDFKKEC